MPTAHPRPMSPRDPAPPAVRKEAVEIMKSHNEGKHREAMVQAVELAVKHGGSALVLNLVGTLQQVSYVACKFMPREDVGSSADAAAEEAMHKSSALSAFSAAAELAPNCIDTAVSHAMMLIEFERYADAQLELIRALHISNPVDPAEHNAGYGLYSDLTFAERLRDSRARARNAMERFTTLICGEIVPMESVLVLRGIKLGGNAAADARALAKNIATTYPFSGRAQLLLAYVDLERVRGLDPAIDKRRFLRRTLDMIQDAADTFHCSLVIALFRAKLLFVLDQYDDADCECHRALAIENPDDPKEHDLPPGSVSGAEYGDRVSFVKDQLRTLIKKIIFEAALYSCLQTSEVEDSLMSVRVKPLIELCNETDKSSAKTITDAVRFLKVNNSWSFWICPLSSRCNGRKFVDTSSLWRHLCSKHPEGLWEKLQSVLGPKPSENTSEGDCSALEWITFSQDSDQHDIFRLIKMDDMFDSLIRLAAGGTEPDLVEMRTEKCREGAAILDGIKQRLRTLPADVSSSQFDEARSGIQNMWLKFLKISVLDYREVIFPLVRSFIWAKLKKGMTDDPSIVGVITASKIDPIFDDAPTAHGWNVSGGHDSNSSDANKMGTTSRQNLKPSRSNETIKAEEDHQESEVCVEDGNSGDKVNQKFSSLPKDVEGSEKEIAEVLANMEQILELEGDVSPATSSPSTLQLLSLGQENFNIPFPKVTHGQSAEEMASTTSYQSVDVLKKENTDKDLFILHEILQSLWNLRCFRDEFLRSRPACILNINGNSCIADLIYRIFSAWEKNENDGMAVLLASVKASLCKIANDDMFQNLQDGKKIASEVVATILQGLHISAASLHFYFNNEIEGREVSPISCRDCICQTHNLFGIMFHVQTSCRCGKSFVEKEHTIIFYRLDAGSPQTTKIKSLAELPVLYDEQLCFEDNCEYCGSPKNIDVSPWNTPHFFTIGLEWFGGCENQVQLSEVLVDIAHPVDIKLLCKGAHFSANYSLASMIFYVDGRYVCFAREDQDKWLIRDAKTVDAVDSWEQLLEHFRDCRLQPEVLFFEVIK